MKLKKYTEYILTKFKILIYEKKYRNSDTTVKYILEKNRNSDTLIIVFSACTRVGIKSRYNYNRTLKTVRANKLFILDDYGTDRRGAFYLGQDNAYNIEKAINELISDISCTLGIQNRIFIGTSKGGYAALYFGLSTDSTIIVGAPQYFLGDYLNCPANMHTLEYIVGDINEKKILELNKLLEEKIRNSKNNINNIYLHYSINDHTYEEHIKYLLREFQLNNKIINCEVLDYVNHHDVSLHFPKFLLKNLDIMLYDLQEWEK